MNKKNELTEKKKSIFINIEIPSEIHMELKMKACKMGIPLKQLIINILKENTLSKV